MSVFGEKEPTLAKRLGCTAHISPLRIKLWRLWKSNPGDAATLEDWLVDVANARGARIVTRYPAPRAVVRAPLESQLSNGELTVGLLLLQNRDRPQMLRLAAQLVSACKPALDELRSRAIQERVEPVLAELARQALRVDPAHPLWRKIADLFGNARPLREPLLHYTRLAEPVPVNGRVNAQRWRLVA
jgi:hypothetical protein